MNGSRICPRCGFATMRPGPQAWECGRRVDCGYSEHDMVDRRPSTTAQAVQVAAGGAPPLSPEGQGTIKYEPRRDGKPGVAASVLMPDGCRMYMLGATEQEAAEFLVDALLTAVGQDTITATAQAQARTPSAASAASAPEGFIDGIGWTYAARAPDDGMLLAGGVFPTRAEAEAAQGRLRERDYEVGTIVAVALPGRAPAPQAQARIPSAASAASAPEDTFAAADRTKAAFEQREAGIVAMRQERDALARFKAYVHERLDQAGVPVDPPSEHREKGCRIGGRLDWLLAKVNLARAAHSLAPEGFTDRARLLHEALCKVANLAPGSRTIDTAERIAKAALEADRAAVQSAPPTPEGQSTAHEMGYALTCAERERDEAREMHRRLLAASTQRINNLERALHKAWAALAVLNPPTIAASVSEGQPSAASAPLAPEGIDAAYDPNRTFGITAEMIEKAKAVLAEGLTTDADRINGLVFCMLREVEKLRRRDAVPPQADAKAIPSPAPQAPPPEGIEDSDLDSTSVLGAMRGFLADHTRPNGSIAKDVSMHLRPSTVGCVLQIVALRTAERDAAIARAERAEKDLEYYKFLHGNQAATITQAWEKLAAAQAERDRMREKLERALRHLKRAEWRSEGHVCEVRRECKSVAQMIDDTLKAKPIPAPGGSSGEGG